MCGIDKNREETCEICMRHRIMQIYGIMHKERRIIPFLLQLLMEWAVKHQERKLRSKQSEY